MLNSNSTGNIDPAAVQQQLGGFSGPQLDSNAFPVPGMQNVPGNYNALGSLVGARPGQVRVPVSTSMQQAGMQSRYSSGMPNGVLQHVGQYGPNPVARSQSVPVSGLSRNGNPAALQNGSLGSQGSHSPVDSVMPVMTRTGSGSMNGIANLAMQSMGGVFKGGMGLSGSNALSTSLGMMQTGNALNGMPSVPQGDMVATVMGKADMLGLGNLKQGLGTLGVAPGPISKDSGKPTFDASDFPSLGLTQNESEPHENGTADLNGADPYSLHFGILRHKHNSQNSEFSIQNEEFPALSGSSAQNHRGKENATNAKNNPVAPGNESMSSVDSVSSSVPEDNVPPNAAVPVDSPHAQAFFQRYGHMMAHSQQIGMPPLPPPKADAQGTVYNIEKGKPPPPQRQSSNPSQVNKLSDDESGHFGLLGLLRVIRMSDADLTTLALGTDLTTLGLNLNSPDNLYKSFVSPWSDTQVAEPEFKVPSCYTQQASPPLQPEHLKNLALETLFYMFYSMVMDKGQVLAAEELWSRGWCFHKELKLWLARVPNTEPALKTDRYERGSFLVFDSSTWDIVRKDNFVLNYSSIVNNTNT